MDNFLLASYSYSNLRLAGTKAVALAKVIEEGELLAVGRIAANWRRRKAETWMFSLVDFSLVLPHQSLYDKELNRLRDVLITRPLAQTQWQNLVE